jgi:hypothetical protein
LNVLMNIWVPYNSIGHCRVAEQLLPSKEGLSFMELDGYSLGRVHTYGDVTTKATTIVGLESVARAIPMSTYWAVCVYVQKHVL